MSERDYSRRNVITGAGLVGATVVLGRNAWGAEAQKETPARQMQGATSAKMTPTLAEELMRQHAVAERLLLIYDAATPPQTGAAQPSAKVIASTAQMLRTTVDELHVQLEEEHIFPLFEKSGKMTDLVSTLREQHTAAKRLTDSILQAAERGDANVESLAPDLRAYTNMILAHTAYEETVLYPQIRTVVSEAEYDQLERELCQLSVQKIGPQGYSGLVAKVADLERSAGITGLAQFTARPGRETAMGTPTQP